ncbi:hypothetical protein LWI28_022354 [Acer negundo]|uniref:Uncharacterized protein n=1 Tax=Acer negundo TaxID=4023 RepID=A0AAD5J2F3_ACENE|nr:hypothetical protein LWI28_022354 [Acer negundo]
MSSEICQLHVFFFPFMAHGHMIPTVDMAKLFGTRGVKTSIITTPANAPLFANPIQRSNDLGIDMDLKIIKFPYVEAGLPEGCENVDATTNSTDPIKSMEMAIKFLKATAMLQEPLEQLLRECRPDCLVADIFFPWANDSAAKFGIPRLVFHGTGFFLWLVVGFVREVEPSCRTRWCDASPGANGLVSALGGVGLWRGTGLRVVRKACNSVSMVCKISSCRARASFTSLRNSVLVLLRVFIEPKGSDTN